MGLDIYAHINISKIPVEDVRDKEGVRNLTTANDEAAKEKLKKFMERAVKRLEKAEKNGSYDETYIKVLKSISRMHNYPFGLEKIGITYGYGDGQWEYNYSVMPLDKFKAAIPSVVDSYGNKYEMYFRKVNFLFEYFSHKMIDEFFAEITLADVNDIISRCEKVLADNSLAEKLLPTRGGFFFGSTSYDKWYFYDVKDCLKQMKKFKKRLEKGADAYMIFSW